jgi:hypothetical protein
MEYKTRQELNALSLKAFGTSSRWQKLVNNGTLQAYERDRQVVVPENGIFTKKVFTDRKVEIKRFTVEEVKKHMMQILEDRHNAEKKRLEAIEAATTEDPTASQRG